MLFSVGNICKRRSYLLCNLHSRLQISGLLRTNPRLHFRCQTINETKHGLSCIHIQTFCVLLGKLHDVMSDRLALPALGHCLPCLVSIVGRLKIIKYCNLKVRPTRNITLDRIPGIRWSIKQGYCHLTLLDVTRKFH